MCVPEHASSDSAEYCWNNLADFLIYSIVGENDEKECFILQSVFIDSTEPFITLVFVSTNPPPLTTRVVSLSTPQTRLRAELIDELVTQWNEKMEEMKEGEGESDRDKNARIAEKDLLQGFFAILRQVDQLEAPETSSCVLPPLE